MKRDGQIDAKHLSALIEGFYAASTEPEKWPEAATQLARFFDSESTAIQLRTGGFDSIALRATTANYDQKAQQDYVAHFYKVDPFVNGWRTVGAAGIHFGHELVDPEAFRNSGIYNDYCRRLGVFHTLGAGVDLGFDTTLLLGIHRPIDREDFAAEHRQRLEIVLPHLSRALQTHRTLDADRLQKRVATEILAAHSVATILVDGEYRVLFANGAADQLLKADDGLRVRQARLTTRDPRQEAALRQAVSLASVAATGSVAPPADLLSVRRAHKRPLSVLVTPLPRDAGSDGLAEASAIVFAHDPETRRPPATAALAALYKLTAAEARLLEALLQGQRITEYAEQAGISPNTANTQLKQIFAKTGTNRQADLMREVWSDPIASSLVRLRDSDS